MPADSFSQHGGDIHSSTEDLSDDELNSPNGEAEEGFNTYFNPADYIADYIDVDIENQDDDESATSQDNNHAEDYDTVSKNERRRQQKYQSKKRCLDRARVALQGDSVAARTWKLRPVKSILPVLGMRLSAHWKCEQLVRAQTADLGVQNGINIHQTLVKVVMRCRVKTCHATLVFDLQPRSGFWKLNKYFEHANECFGQVVPAPGASPTNRRKNHNKACAPAYTAQQIARCILEEASCEPNINSKTIAALVKARVSIVDNHRTRITGPSAKSSSAISVYRGL